MRMSATKPSTPTAISLGRKGRFMASAFGRNRRPGRWEWRGDGIGFLSFEAFDVLEREHYFVAAADHDGRDAVPFVHNLEFYESGVLLQCIAANHNRFGLALGADDSGVGFN